MPATSSVPYVLLHGINNSPTSWQGVAAGLKDREVIVPILPARRDVDEIAAELLEQLPERFILVGHSFGGYVALAMLANHEERIEGLVLVNTLDNADTPQVAEGRRAKATEALRGGYPGIARVSAAKTYHPQSLESASLMTQRDVATAEYGAERFAAHQEASARRADRRALLRETRVPVLVIAARDDQVISSDKQCNMATAVDADWRCIGDQAGHMLPAEQPDLLAEHISEWAAGSRTA